MKNTLKQAVLTATFVASLTVTTFAAGFGLEGPGVNYTGYDWLTTTSRAGYALIPANVTSEVDTARRITIWTTVIKEVPNPWTITNEVLPSLKAQGVDTEMYKDYSYTLSTYHIAVKYDYKTIAEARSNAKTYYVSKVSEQDYDKYNNKIGGPRYYQENFVQVTKGSDSYEIAYEIEKGYYNEDVLKSLPAVRARYNKIY